MMYCILALYWICAKQQQASNCVVLCSQGLSGTQSLAVKCVSKEHVTIGIAHAYYTWPICGFKGRLAGCTIQLATS